MLHDWGSALGFDWARRYPDAVQAIAYLADEHRRSEPTRPTIAEAEMRARDPYIGGMMIRVVGMGQL